MINSLKAIGFAALVLGQAWAAPASAELSGSELSARVLFQSAPSDQIQSISFEDTGIVGPGVEFPSLAALDIGSNPFGLFVVDVSVDAGNDYIEFGFTNAGRGNFASGFFNGWRFTFDQSLGINILSASVDTARTNLGISDQSLVVEGNQLFVNVASLPYGPSSVARININAADAIDSGGSNAECASLTLSPSEARVLDAYIAYYGRPPDVGGLAFWEAQLDDAQGNLTSIINAFGNSQEFVDRFGGFDAEGLLINLYQQLFNRSPDLGGLAFWLGRLSSGESTLQEISVQLLDGATGVDINTLSGKRAMAIHYLGLQREQTGFGLNSASQFTLLRDAGISAAHAEQSCAIVEIMKTAWLRGEDPVLAYAYNRSDACPTPVPYDVTVAGTPLGTLPPGTRMPSVRHAGIYSVEFLDTETPRLNSLSAELTASPSGFAWGCDFDGFFDGPNELYATLLTPDLDADGSVTCTWGVAETGACEPAPSVEGVWQALGDSQRIDCAAETNECEGLVESNFAATIIGIPAETQDLPALQSITELSEGRFSVEALILFRSSSGFYQRFEYQRAEIDFTPPNRNQFSLSLPGTAEAFVFVRD